jgi:SAM-dependent methyltransferase
VRKLIQFQTWLSICFDRLLPPAFRVDGNRDFLDSVVPENVRPGTVVYDVGGGKNPVISPQRKARLGLRVVGVDIDAAELADAPAGSYDQTACADITRYQGAGDADLVICQALLEHVRDTEGAFRAISSILKPGGRALVFVPSRNAVYARLNLLLPEAWKRWILFSIFPSMERDHGFPAFYNQCTPAGFSRLSSLHQLETENRRLYFQSDYFRFFFPLHALWRLWTLLFRLIGGPAAAETFTLVLRKQ